MRRGVYGLASLMFLISAVLLRVLWIGMIPPERTVGGEFSLFGAVALMVILFSLVGGLFACSEASFSRGSIRGFMWAPALYFAYVFSLAVENNLQWRGAWLLLPQTVLTLGYLFYLERRQVWVEKEKQKRSYQFFELPE